MYTEKHDEIESIVGALVTTVLNVCIVIAALKFRTRAKPVDMTTPSARLAFAAGIAAVLIGGKTIRSTDPHQAWTDESDPVTRDQQR